MLHQTHLLLQRYPFPFPSPPKPSPSSTSSLVEKGGMGRIVKGGLTPKMILEDVCATLSPPLSSSSLVVAAGEDFFVDQLLNLNNNDEIELLETPDFHKQQQQQNQQQQQQNQQQQQQNQQQQQQNQQQQQQNQQQQQQNEQQEVNEEKDDSFLSPPLDTAEEADLEWLSHFVDDSSCPYSSPFPPGYVRPKPESEPKPELRAAVGEEEQQQEEEGDTPLSLRRARRNKRARTGGRFWVEDSFAYYSLARTSPAQKHVVRKRERGSADPAHQLTRCTHCGVNKTPQWRAGPNGPKTLCNACGVRYKSGRLLPEYRPAISPTFSSELHSNSHRKVMEMRMKKDAGGPPHSSQIRLFRPVSECG